MAIIAHHRRRPITGRHRRHRAIARRLRRQGIARRLRRATDRPPIIGAVRLIDASAEMRYARRTDSD